jgi:hypothetical protein
MASRPVPAIPSPGLGEDVSDRAGECRVDIFGYHSNNIRHVLISAPAGIKAVLPSPQSPDRCLAYGRKLAFAESCYR